MKKAKSSRKVVVADSRDFYRLMIGELLRSYGYEVRVVSSQSELIDAVKEERPHLMVLDLSIAGATGAGFIDEFRGLAAGRDFPVIATTEFYLEDHEVEKLKQAGVIAFVNKAMPIEEILAHVNLVLFPREKDLRKSPRAQVSVPVSFELDGVWHSSHTFNLSRDGMFVVTLSAPPPAPNTTVRLRFWLPSSEDVIRCDGVVIWCNNYGSRINELYPPGMGIMFSNLNPAHADSVNRYVRERLQNIFQ